jgi:hypothetical protein
MIKVGRGHRAGTLEPLRSFLRMSLTGVTVVRLTRSIQSGRSLFRSDDAIQDGRPRSCERVRPSGAGPAEVIMLNFTQRVIGALKLQVPVYEEVEADTRATGQALAIVVISSVATGLGVSRTSSLAALTAGALAALLGWFIWAGLTYVIGVKILPEPQTKSDIGELMRTTGFASSPAVFNLLARLPLIGVFVSFAVSVWMLVAMVIAVRQALDYKSTGRAVGVCLIGWFIYVAVAAFLGNLSQLH